MSVNDNNENFNNVPEELHDPANGKTYKQQGFLGKGGFARCYEIIDVATSQVYAGKIIPKKLMQEYQRQKIIQEIAIHKSLDHKNIVQFYGCFDDVNNMYIVLELCKRRSMLELHKCRNIITEYECRYYIHQISEGVKYLHENHIVHRDLKLGNLLLNDKLHVKIGDFGLATMINYEGELKKTTCGTPNYTAPEIITQRGHSYPVDIWSIGCVMYTLLVGQPPFQSGSLNDTYARIKKCNYRMPDSLKPNATEMILAMLQINPDARPTIYELFGFEFISNRAMPTSLPLSCLTMTPRLEFTESQVEPETRRKPLTEANSMPNGMQLELVLMKNGLNDSKTMLPDNFKNLRTDLQKLNKQINLLIQTKPHKMSNIEGDENADPNAQPLHWISKWVDFSHKCGFCYELCDGLIGVMFNDTTKLVMLPNGRDVYYIDKNGKEMYLNTLHFRDSLKNKIKLLEHFKRYMNDHLASTGECKAVIENDHISRFPHLHTWFKTTCAVVLLLTNGTLQLNFFDHVKIILCPHMNAVTYIDNDKTFRTYRFSTITIQGCSKNRYRRLRYANKKIQTILESLC